MTSLQIYSKCNFCVFASNRSDALKRHKLIHSSEKIYKCQHCEFAASDPSYLKKHQRVHSGVRPFKCDLCDFASAQSGGLKNHKLTHEPIEKTFKCDICDYSTSRPRYLKQHQKSISHINREKALQQTDQREEQDSFSFIMFQIRCINSTYNRLNSNALNVLIN